MIKTLFNTVVPVRYRPFNYLTGLALSRCDRRVRLGPFRQMRYVTDSQGSCLVPKLLGIYERELHPVIEEICDSDVDLLIDIGAAEGYYAVGLAMRMPKIRVLAFEMAEHGRALLAEMCHLNAVSDRIEIRGKCEPADLGSALTQSVSPLLVVDCEGYEQVLLDPAAVDLRQARILVETHDMCVSGVTELLKTRFASTHKVDEICSQSRSISEYPFSSLYTHVIPLKYKKMIVSERELQQSWLWITPKSAMTAAVG